MAEKIDSIVIYNNGLWTVCGKDKINEWKYVVH